jgi:hypothetical protein
MSEVEICNWGLSTYLGEDEIASLDDRIPAARLCKLHYNRVRRGMLESHWWNFALGRQTLALITNDRSEWLYRYAVPSGCLSIHWVNDPAIARIMLESQRSPDTKREVTDQDIYSDVPGASCEFTRDIADTTRMPQKFKDALAAGVAAAVAMPLTQKAQLAQSARQQMGALMEMAMAWDEQQTPEIEYMTAPDYLRERGAV